MRFLIVGSCVSRDLYTRLQRNGHTLASYVARQSLVSAQNPADPQLLDPAAFSSSFQLRACRDDLRSSLPEVLLNESFDVVLWDLIDERRGLLELESGGICTDNWELAATGQRGQLGVVRHIEFGSDEHFARWQDGVRSFFSLLSARNSAHRVILVAPQFASSTTDSSPIVGENIHSPQWLTSAYARYTDFIRSNFDCSIVDLEPGEVLADKQHRWGLAPFHYAEHTEQLLADAVSRQLPLRSLEKARFAAYQEAKSAASSQHFREGEVTELDERIAGLPLQARFCPKSTRLPVLALFNGAIDPMRAAGKPVFQRFSWNEEFQASTAYFHDSTQTLHPTLRISWGLGDGVLTLAPLHAGALEGYRTALETQLGAQQPNLHLFGSSAGGFQALRVATLLSDASTLVNNPQLDWLKYEVRSAVRDVLSTVYAHVPQDQVRDQHGAEISLTTWWSQLGVIPSFKYLLNCASKADVDLQYLPFMRWLAGPQVPSPSDVHVRTYLDQQAGHNPLPRARTLAELAAWMRG